MKRIIVNRRPDHTQNFPETDIPSVSNAIHRKQDFQSKDFDGAGTKERSTQDLGLDLQMPVTGSYCLTVCILHKLSRCLSRIGPATVAC